MGRLWESGRRKNRGYLNSLGENPFIWDLRQRSKPWSPLPFVLSMYFQKLLSVQRLNCANGVNGPIRSPLGATAPVKILLSLCQPKSYKMFTLATLSLGQSIV